MPVRQFLSRTDFTNPDTALDLYGNSLRSAFSYDVYEGKSVFDAVVLTRPLFLVDAEIRPDDTSAGFVNQSAREAGRLDKFAFKARILPSDCPSPHAYIPDPCDIQVAEEYSDISKLYNLHTTFISSDDYTRSNSAVPKIGDIVRVELVRNIFSFNLQFGTFLSVRTNNNGVLPSTTSATTEDGGDPTSEWNCTTAINLFYESDTFSEIREGMSSAEMRQIARNFLTRMRSELSTTEVYVRFVPPSSWFAEGPGWAWDHARTQERLGITQEVFDGNLETDETIDSPYTIDGVPSQKVYDGPVDKKYFATGTDSLGVTYGNQLCGPWRTSNADYPMTKCADCSFGSIGSLKLHPVFCEYMQAAVEATKIAVPATEFRVGSDQLRTTEDQIYLRIMYNCGTTYADIMNNRRAPCDVPVALPGYSNHEIGLAVDLGGTLTSPSTTLAKVADPPSAARQTETYRWMRANIHNKSSIRVPGSSATAEASVRNLGNIKNMDREPWHWSYNGG